MMLAWSNNKKAGAVTLSSNQQFFNKSKKTWLIDMIFDLNDEAPLVKGRHRGHINFGSGLTSFTMENSIMQTYTGTGEGIDLNTFLNQTPLLPRAAHTSCAAC
ncbi:unnamed protein product [Cyclocybe aegerita]|uniref:Uncharacterized protein n=1 Tax=Cyclocybe aegerita TaxID=1973307 RepID=A0A8S0WWW9_CYCAE|nr:unnamed protein product [Cyclocybe aegerita]